MIELIDEFLSRPNETVCHVHNERGLQLELGLFLRLKGYAVEFEKPYNVSAHADQTKRQKRYLDLLIGDVPTNLAIELKCPYAGRVPETMYDFIADIAFTEAILRENMAASALCLMLTHDPAFWSGRPEGIYEAFRSEGVLSGLYRKPTGSKSSQVFLENRYDLKWKPLGNTGLLKNAQYLLVEVFCT